MPGAGRRSGIADVENGPEPYLTTDVRYLDEPIGDALTARGLSERVSQRFLRYLELLQPALDDDEGPEIEIEVVVDDEPDAERSEGSGAAGDPDHEDVTAGTDADRRELLMAAARRLVTPEDPTALSYVLAGVLPAGVPARPG